MNSRISIAARISILYLFFSTVWILMSGYLADKLAAGNTVRLRNIEQYKGIFFVVVTTVLLYLVSRSLYRKILHVLNEYKVMLKKNSALGLASKEGIYEYDIAKGEVVFNSNLKKILGTEDPIRPDGKKYWEDGIHPEDRNRVLERNELANRQGDNYWIQEYRFQKEDGGYRHVLHSVYMIRDNQGNAFSVIGAVQDITELRELQMQYHRQELEQKMALASSIISAEEKERNRWAEELHDNISQILSVARLYTGTLTNPEINIATVAGKIREMIDNAIQEIRQLSANLKPPRFEIQGLKESIEMLIYYIRQVKQIRFSVQVDPRAGNLLDEDQQLMIYRIIQEQLNNITRHAEATEVAISIEIIESLTRVRIKDNGKGFDGHTLKDGTGMKNIRSRLALFHGRLEIHAATGNGCELEAWFPTCIPASIEE